MPTASDSCAHCALPCAPGEQYCCSGCAFVHALVSSTDEERRGAQARVAVCAFFAMNLMAVTLVLYAESFAGPGARVGGLHEIFRWASALFAAPILAILGGSLLASCASRRPFEALPEILVLGGAVTAYGVSIAALVSAKGETYFEVSAMVLLLFCAGRAIEAMARARAASGLSAAVRPSASRCERWGEGAWHEIAGFEVTAGDSVRVQPGFLLPADGESQSATLVDRAAVTGESAPVNVPAGESLYAGDVVLSRPAVYLATREPSQSRAAQVESAAARAAGERAPCETIAQRGAAVLLGGALAAAAGTFTYWTMAVGAASAVWPTLAVLLCACPCAFGIATPLALSAASARAAAKGIEFRSHAEIERAAGVRAIAFDKTGTLTTKRVEASDVEAPGGRDDRRRALSILAAFQRVHASPWDVEQLAHDGSAATDGIEELLVLPGAGLSGRLGGRAVAVGNARLVAEYGLQAPDGAGSAYVVDEGRVLAVVDAQESIAAGAREAVSELRALGLPVLVLTGDSDSAAERVCAALSVPFKAFLEPETKLAELEAFERAHGRAVMVGDGTNDGPVLAGACLGVALGRSADLARIAAPIRLRGDDLRALPWMLSLARFAMRVVRQNMVWAAGYNAVCVAAAATGRLSPLLAAVAMALSSAFVAANSLRVLRFSGGDIGEAARSDSMSLERWPEAAALTGRTETAA